MADRLGRERAMQAQVGASRQLSAPAPSFRHKSDRITFLTGGRLVAGLAIGCLSMVVW
jgi:hypothetical protein